ncbi:uncharacterized protein IL334_003665 [Kwoniella shivajii]|uniref:Uncharacterized protein n=1 Tax=Kwoniella shivajii TaxID=564305 RepID=A0ABZ1CZF1_9TREE|nr:hypothetical protein IL334_003665 [Kwoniella shivajii]
MEYLIFSPIPSALPPAHISPVTNGLATQAITRFANGLSGMQVKWLSFVDEHFEQDGRFQLLIGGDVLKCYDILASTLPRFFIILFECDMSTQKLNLFDVSESTDGFAVQSDHVEWQCGDSTWKGILSADLAPSLKLDKLEMIIEIVGEKGLPDSVTRVLETAQYMECVVEVMDVVENNHMDPLEMLKQLM